MAKGDFEAAWRVSDRVLATRELATRDDPESPYHLRWVWDGRSLDGKNVLVRCYHGLGDTIQFCRFLPYLRRRVKHLTVEVQPELMDLLNTVEGPEGFIPFDPAHPAPPSECDLEIMELAHALRLAPRAEPYLSASRRGTSPTFRMGLCWRSSQTWMLDRSVPSPLLTPLLAHRNVEFVSLQPEATIMPGFTDDCPRSIAATAQLIAGLDLVLSVDTMVAHLAGALGTPLWLLLKADADWRWLAGGQGSVWYDQVRKFSQPRSGDWETPIRAVIVALRQLLDTGTSVGRNGSHNI